MEPLAPGMRRTGKVMRRMPGASIARATPAEIERNSGARAPELIARLLQGSKPRGVTSEDREVEGIAVRIYRPSTGSGTGANSSVPEPVEGPKAMSSAPEPVEGPKPNSPVPEPVEGPGAQSPVPEPVEGPKPNSPAPEPAEGPKPNSPVPEPVEGPKAMSSVPEPVDGPGAQSPVPEPVEGPKAMSSAPEPVEGPRANSPAPEPVEGPKPKPLILYFHGGGFVYGDVRGGDWICGTVAKELDAVVVSVEYRLAPKHPFPAGVDDCYAALVWAAANAASLGADGTRIGVIGESAGGNLAAVVALMARDRKGPVIRHQALLYPATGAGDTESRRVNADAYILTFADMEKFGELYGGDPTDWRVSPIVAKSLRGLPPAIVIVGGHDPLHDDGTLYADALRAVGVDVELIDYPAMPHGFMNFPRYAKDAKPAIAAVVASQRAALRRI